MSPFLSEFIGTALLIILGNGVVANVVLKDTKGNNSGWIVIAFGWAMAVFVAVYVAAPASGAHLNPAVTLSLSIAGKFAWSDAFPYIIAQILGAMAGSLGVWLTYRDHFEATEDKSGIRACFCTAPAIHNPINNFITECLATFVFMLSILFIVSPTSSLGALDALPVALLVLAIGLSLGGPTGYAINPARDLGPRIMHLLLPMRHKGNSGWAYSWIPVLGPIVGGGLAALVFGWL
jgi:glycerol uptake facilitator protein